MPYSAELLDSAVTLSHSKPETQANLRRAISTAYYAVFHLLINETCGNWHRPEQRYKLARVFDHRTMAVASRREADKNKKAPEGSVPSQLQMVAAGFCRLQDMRHRAEYDLSEIVSYEDAELAIVTALKAFTAWDAIRDDQIAQDYLFSLLFKDRP